MFSSFSYLIAHFQNLASIVWLTSSLYGLLFNLLLAGREFTTKIYFYHSTDILKAALTTTGYIQISVTGTLNMFTESKQIELSSFKLVLRRLMDNCPRQLYSLPESAGCRPLLFNRISSQYLLINTLYT